MGINRIYGNNFVTHVQGWSMHYLAWWGETHHHQWKPVEHINGLFEKAQ